MWGRRRQRQRRYADSVRGAGVGARIGVFFVLLGLLFAVVFAVVVSQRLDDQSFSMLLGGLYTLGVVGVLLFVLAVVLGAVGLVAFRIYQVRAEREARAELRRERYRPVPPVYMLPSAAPPSVADSWRSRESEYKTVPRKFVEMVGGEEVGDA